MPLAPPFRRSRLDLGPKPNPLRRTEAPSSRPTPFAGTPWPGLAHGRRMGPRSSLGRRRGGRDRGAGRLRRVIPAPPIPRPYPRPSSPATPAPHSVIPAPPPRRPRLDLGPKPNPLRRTEAPSSRPTPFAGTPWPGLAHERRMGPRSSLGRRRGGRDRGAGLSAVILAPTPSPRAHSVTPRPPRHPASTPSPRPLPVAPDLIWGPNPSHCAGQRPRAAGRRRSRELRGLVSLTDAA